MGNVIRLPQAVFEAKARRMQQAIQLPSKPKVSQQKATRNGLLAKLHIAKKEFGMTESEYRAFLFGNFGTESAKHLSMRQLRQAIGLCRKLGWVDKPSKVKADKHGLPTPLANKEVSSQTNLLRAIEALMAELGRLRGKYIPWDYAASILRKQTGLPRLEYASTKQLQAVRTALERTVSRTIQ